MIELPLVSRFPSNTHSRALSLVGNAMYATIPPFLVAVLPALALKVTLELYGVNPGATAPPRPAILEHLLPPRDLNNLGLWGR